MINNNFLVPGAAQQIQAATQDRLESAACSLIAEYAESRLTGNRQRFEFAWELAGKTPLLDKQIEQWEATKPLKGLSILHYVPITHSTVRKVAALIAGGAEVALMRSPLNNPVQDDCCKKLKQAGVKVFDTAQEVTGSYDYFLDCFARLLRIEGLTPPRQGYVELTQGGLQFYSKVTNRPVVCVDNSRVKCLETTLGTGEGVVRALKEVFSVTLENRRVVLFGYGKVGTGIAKYLKENGACLTVIEKDPASLERARSHEGHKVVDSSSKEHLREAIVQSEVIITATGVNSLVSKLFPSPEDLPLFAGKVLANAGAGDEFGSLFKGHSGLLCEGGAVNFSNRVPTDARYLDATFVLHNEALLWIQEGQVTTSGVHPVPEKRDEALFSEWRQIWPKEDLSTMSDLPLFKEVANKK